MRDLIEAHDRVKDFDWEPTYATKRERYPTKYRIPAKTKDPFRHLIRDYVSMEQEKDDRQYGSMEDVLARSGAPAKAERRWMEILKAAIPIVNFGEYAAMKSCGQLIESIDNAELRQGYMAQMLDEVRHTNQEMYLTRYFAKHSADPEGFAQAMQVKGSNMFNRAGRSALENFFVGDPIEGALNLQVVAETAYTNPIFVALTEVAALNGDQTTPSVFLSIQSDEARHMANGYSTLAAVVSNPENLQHLQADFDRAFWRQHAFLDPFLGVVYDYFQTNRSTAYIEKWNEWIADDWVGSYIAKLEPFGLKIPRWFDEAQERMKWVGHTAAMVAFSAWPLQFWRFDPLTDADIEWFEEKYPGWYDNYGFFWEGYRELIDPKEGASTLSLFEQLPPLCRVCQMPTIFPRIDISTARVRIHEGTRHAFCSDACEFIFNEDPQRYLAYKTFYELYEGYSLEEFIRENGLLRADGKTLMAQPSLDDERMWTIDDVAALNYEIKNPLNELTSDWVLD
jgi:hypothetical protein